MTIVPRRLKRRRVKELIGGNAVYVITARRNDFPIHDVLSAAVNVSGWKTMAMRENSRINRTTANKNRLKARTRRDQLQEDEDDGAYECMKCGFRTDYSKPRMRGFSPSLK